MSSSDSDQSSFGGVPLTPALPLKQHPNANAIMQCWPTAIPVAQRPPTSLSASFNDIRTACQSAQNRIMRLQQATNNQVGLTSTIREGWFSELRNVAQCFITAQQASARIEQGMNTERAQLQGALSAALNERDLMKTERDANAQEIEFLRQTIKDLQAKKENVSHNAEAKTQALPSRPKNDNWYMAYHSGGAYNGQPDNESILESSFDSLPAMPLAVEDMPLSPKQNNVAPLNSNNNNNWGAFGGYASEGAEIGDQIKSAMPPRLLNNNYSRPESRFFHRDSGTTAENSGSRALHTPASNSRNPFSPPPVPSLQPSAIIAKADPVRQHQPIQPPIQPKLQSHHSQGQDANQVHIQSQGQSQSQSQNQLVTKAPILQPASTMSRDLTVSDGTKEIFMAGVEPAPGSEDETRVQDIFLFFNNVKKWVDKYCCNPDKGDVNSLGKRCPRLWDYACSATYPSNRSHASSHTLFMLSNKAIRTYFVTRLLIQFIVQQMWSPQAWEGLNEKLTEVLENIRTRLDPKHGYDAILLPQDRHVLVEERSRAIYEFMRQPGWSRIKSTKINSAVTRFKDIVGPMMNTANIERQDALHELSVLGEDALRLSAVLNTSRLSFQFIFNECGIKFSDQSHRSLNTPNVTARDLQAHHWRLMCVITPGITYRNEAGVSVDPRFFAKANVLVMQ